MRIALPIFVALGVRAYDGTTIFDTILLAHPEPTYCPSPTVGHVFTPDANYAVCCYDGFPSVTQTTATGPGGKKIYACCMDGYSCTGAAPVMSDWSIDKAGRHTKPTNECFNLLLTYYSQAMSSIQRSPPRQCLTPRPL